MESAIGRFLFARLPKVRRRKDEPDSVLAGLLDALGTVLDAAKDTVQSLRRRGFVWEQDAAHAYYADSLRGGDLDRHALDRGTRRLAAETDLHLRERLQRMPHVRLHMGSAMGMKHLVEDVLGHVLGELVMYGDDPQGRILLAQEAQGLHAEASLSHLFSAADQADPDTAAIRQNRLFSFDDLDARFTFHMTVETLDAIDEDEQGRIVELVMAEKPAHASGDVAFWTPVPVHAWSSDGVLAAPFGSGDTFGLQDLAAGGAVALDRASYHPVVATAATGSTVVKSGVNLHALLHGQRDAYLTFRVRLESTATGNAGLLLLAANYALLVNLVGAQLSISVPWSTPRANTSLAGLFAAQVDYSVAVKLAGGQHSWWVRRVDTGALVASGSDGTDDGRTINLPTDSLAASELLVFSSAGPARQVTISHVNVGRANASQPDFDVYPNDVIACLSGVTGLAHRRASLLASPGFGPPPGTYVVSANGAWSVLSAAAFGAAWRLVGGTFVEGAGVTTTGYCGVTLRAAPSHPRLGHFEASVAVAAVTGSWRLHVHAGGRFVSSAVVTQAGTVPLPARDLDGFVGDDAGLDLSFSFEPLDATPGSLTIGQAFVLSVTTGTAVGLPDPATLPVQEGRLCYLAELDQAVATGASVLSTTDDVSLDPERGWSIRIAGFVRDIDGPPVVIGVGSLSVAISTPARDPEIGPMVQVDVAQMVGGETVFSVRHVCRANLMRERVDVVVAHSAAAGLALFAGGREGVERVAPAGAAVATSGPVTVASERSGAKRLFDSIDVTPRRKLWPTVAQAADYDLGLWTAYSRVAWADDTSVSYALGDVALLFKAPVDCRIRAVYFGLTVGWMGGLADIGVGTYDEASGALTTIAAAGVAEGVDLSSSAVKNAHRVTGDYESLGTVLRAGEVVYLAPAQACQIVANVRIDLEAA